MYLYKVRNYTSFNYQEKQFDDHNLYVVTIISLLVWLPILYDGYLELYILFIVSFKSAHASGESIKTAICPLKFCLMLWTFVFKTEQSHSKMTIARHLD